MTDGPMSASTPIQLRITLVDSEPEVWRQVVVPGAVALADLHGIIQDAMGWERSHDHSFQAGLGAEKVLLAEEKRLSAVLADAGDSLIYYNYDLESGWRHRIVGESLSHSDAGALPVCTAGGSACPPEGSGGIWGYDQFLAKLEDVEDPDYVNLLDQYGDFDPGAFDLTAVNARLLG